MVVTLSILSGLVIILSLLPFFRNQHWIFRVAEFIKVQLLILQLILCLSLFLYIREYPVLWYLQGVQLALIVYHCQLLARYTKVWRRNIHTKTERASDVIKIIACNVYQPNTDYTAFIKLIKEEDPDIFLTMESNSDWERAMRTLERDYPTYKKVTLENTYGMHFYTRLKARRIQTHFFVADDIPSIEAELETRDGHRFVFFGVHPPPPSPTEEDTSKERDGDLLSVAKRVRESTLPVVVTGDFNNVAWSRSSVLFKKTSGLIDARIGRGILATFHARYRLFRIPLDLLFHSPDVFVDALETYPAIGSDHFPVGCYFYIDEKSDVQEDEVVDLKGEERKEVEELIEEGQREQSDNRK